MRHTISGVIAALAVLTVGAAPAMACGGGLFGGGCAPCGHAYVSPCAPQVYDGYGYGYGVVETYQRLPDPTRYYYVDQGPTYTGPGNFAPVPFYQERAVSVSAGYGYRGGRYANAITHYYDGAPAWRGPAIYSYRSRSHARPWRVHSRHYADMRRTHRGEVYRGHMRRDGMYRGYGHRSMHQGMRHDMRYGAPRYSHHAPRHHYRAPPRRYY
ncbi:MULTISPECIES: hypothetical protein [Rhodopseudomonas]|uniref:Uncharacterized protein n=1 Tax=Rhodopseudomonas palustris TaxID=1076 RepID=A0A0D7EU05_RHOPL|nr:MULTISPECIES: hypothetical protein [Rhodopseudomonas]KIZ42917.1 hypothetical protein OO17_12125 [Rhodopseudomonas palustris]MDF3810654.1 hypothetical protein [Rhodopseudomonas sp. BAL398]WOK18447.1 hypothetical protein RBJ75_02640 [Rhodopseudomonas sp. BAL398]